VSKLGLRFGTDGVRGIIGETITDLTVAIIAEATLRYWYRRYGVSKVLVGYDTRFMSKDSQP
jgi:Phosphomannomutase